MKKLLFILFTTFNLVNAQNQQQATLLYNWQDTSLASSYSYDNTYNECWGLVINNKEFAVIGSTSGTHFFDVTDPKNSYEVAFAEGAFTGGGVIHRDYHDYNGYLYAVCDEGATSTLQIIDITDLPNSINIVYDSNELFTKAHNIFIDTAQAKLYVCAVKHTVPNNFATAMEIYSLNDPLEPLLLYTYNDVGHVHDAYVRNDTAYLNCGNDGLRIVDFSTLNLSIPTTPLELASLTSYPDQGYNHSGWLNKNGNLYIMQDENHGYDIKLLDVSDLNNISILSLFNSGVNPNSMAHNGIIKDNLAYIPYYHDGLRVFDLSNASNPIQTWEYDTYLQSIDYCAIHPNHLSYKGAWGVYPYLPSGNIIVSDMQTGLYIIELSTNSTNIVERNLQNNIFPNPAINTFTFTSKADNIKIYNSLGIKIRDQKLNQNQNTIHRDKLANGLYFYSLNKNGKKLSSGKIIFK